MRLLKLRLISATVAILAATGTLAAADVLRVGGTGAATGMLRHLASEFGRSDVKMEVVPSLGSSGAIRALADAVLDVAVSGRALKREEAERGLVEVMALRTPYGLVTSHRSPNGLNSADIAGIYALGKARWADNTPIRVILRPRSDSDTPLLGSLFPGMSAAIEAARKRPDVPTAATDQDSVDLAERVPGSLAGATLTQIAMEKPNLRFVAIDGVEPTAESFVDGRYRHAKTLHVLVGAAPKPGAAEFVAFLKSPAGQRALRAASLMPSPE